MKWIKTRVDEELYNRIVEYARRNNISPYEATRRLIRKGLEHEAGLYRLLNDDSFLISLITVKTRYDVEFARTLSKILNEALLEEEL